MSKKVVINIRTTKNVRELIDLAAKEQFKTRTEFIIGASIERANEVILEHACHDFSERGEERGVGKNLRQAY